jgi:transcriptional regulator with XRE-family HTH domain
MPSKSRSSVSAFTTSPGRFTLAGVEYVPFAEICNDLKWHKSRMETMVKKCPYYDNGILPSVKRRPPGGHNDIRVMTAANYDTFKQKVLDARSGRFTYKGKVYLSVRKALQELRLPGSATTRGAGPKAVVKKPRRSNIHQWHNQGCHQLAGNKLRGERFNFREKGKGTSDFWPLEDDILRIKESNLQTALAEHGRRPSFATTLLTLRMGVGLSHAQLADKAGLSISSIHLWEAGKRTPMPAKAEALAEALGVSVAALHLPPLRQRIARRDESFDGVFRDNDGVVLAYTVRRAAKESIFSGQYIEDAARRLNKHFRSIFREGRLPAEDRQVPGTKKWVMSVLASDLEDLQVGFERILRAGARRARFLRTASAICDFYSVTNRSDRIALGELLTYLGDNNALRFECFPVPRPESTRKWTAPRQYYPDEVKRLFEACDVVALARKFTWAPDSVFPIILAPGGQVGLQQAPPVCPTGGAGEFPAAVGAPAAGTTCHAAANGTLPDGATSNIPVQAAVQPAGTCRTNPRTEEATRLNYYCFVRYKRGDKLLSIRKGAGRDLGREPKEDSHVLTNAKRFARMIGVPFQRLGSEVPATAKNA